MFGKMKKIVGGAVLFAIVGAVAGVTPVVAQSKIAVIDSDRIVMESDRGKAALESIKSQQDAKMAEGRAMEQEIVDLRKRLEEGQLSLAPERIEELKRDYEAKVVAIQRFQEDAEKELGKLRDKALMEIEKDVIGIIDTMGKEGTYTLIFNKFRSGLLFADDAVDITNQVIQRFNTSGG